MRIDVPLERLTDDDCVRLAALFSGRSGPDGWQAVFSELAEALRIEMARRKVERAKEADPIGYEWFGRLEPPS